MALPPSKSNHVTLGHWYSTARVSKRLIYETTACLRARYCTSLAWFDLVSLLICRRETPNSRPKNRTSMARSYWFWSSSFWKITAVLYRQLSRLVWGIGFWL